MKKNHETAMKLASEITPSINSITPHPQPPQINNLIPMIYSTNQNIKNENKNRIESPPPAEPTIVKKEQIKCENNGKTNLEVETNNLLNQPTSHHFTRSHNFLPDFGLTPDPQQNSSTFSSFATNFSRSLSTTMPSSINGMLMGGTNGIAEAYANYANTGISNNSTGVEWFTNPQWPIYYPYAASTNTYYQQQNNAMNESAAIEGSVKNSMKEQPDD
uniref:Uncharacterized protein n=1 Tax=Meloidogyne hapla TaxID=6305 RepID=A0A1I8BRI9_MELHA